MAIDVLARHQAVAELHTPHYAARVAAGFPSPADDYMDGALDLNQHLIKHPAATFFCRVSGNSMTGIGIFDGDLLIVDRALTPVHGDVVLAALEGELTCKVLDLHRRRLLSANDDYPPLPVHEDTALEVEGVVITSVRYHRVCAG